MVFTALRLTEITKGVSAGRGRGLGVWGTPTRGQETGINQQKGWENKNADWGGSVRGLERGVMWDNATQESRGVNRLGKSIQCPRGEKCKIRPVIWMQVRSSEGVTLNRVWLCQTRCAIRGKGIEGICTEQLWWLTRPFKLCKEEKHHKVERQQKGRIYGL